MAAEHFRARMTASAVCKGNPVRSDNAGLPTPQRYLDAHNNPMTAQPESELASCSSNHPISSRHQVFKKISWSETEKSGQGSEER